MELVGNAAGRHAMPVLVGIAVVGGGGGVAARGKLATLLHLLPLLLVVVARIQTGSLVWVAVVGLVSVMVRAIWSR